MADGGGCDGVVVVGAWWLRQGGGGWRDAQERLTGNRHAFGGGGQRREVNVGWTEGWERERERERERYVFEGGRRKGNRKKMDVLSDSKIVYDVIYVLYILYPFIIPLKNNKTLM